MQERGLAVKLLPACYVRAYVKRNKTDAADAAALLEAARCGDILPLHMLLTHGARAVLNAARAAQRSPYTQS